MAKLRAHPGPPHVHFLATLLGGLFLTVACGNDSKPTSPGPIEALCKDGLDNDQDGRADCDDVDCQSPGGDCKPAPALDRTVASTLSETAALLYTGNNPLQKGANPKVFDPKRVAMLHGRISDAAGAPLAGVRVTIQGHEEYGHTFSRADGSYDMAVNGGSRLLLEYGLEGYLQAQRSTQPGWQRHVAVADVGLVAAAGKVSSVAVDAADSQAISGNAITDAHGTREPLLVFPAGTVANAILPNGSTEPLSALTVTVTEYPISSTKRSLPGSPKATTGVSYALEFEVAEATKLGALHVEFSQPISLYVENFFGLPVGSTVALSTYDRSSGQWENGSPGHVIQILDVAGGVATVDSNGDGLADDDATLDALGISASDLGQLGERHTAGTQLWHGKLTHFSSANLDAWLGAPKGAFAPAPIGLRKSTPDHPSRVGPVMVEPRAVSHGIPLTGTPYSLQYQSMRAKGYGDAYQLELPLTGPILPPGLKRITYRVDVAGRVYEGTAVPEVNQKQPIQWDGRDNHDRMLQSPQRADVYIGYVFDGIALNGMPLTPPEEVELGATFYVKMGLWDAKALNLGGFGLDVLHAFDPALHTIYFGTGEQRSGDSIALVTKPTNTVASFSLGTPDSLFVGSDGSLIVTDDQQQDDNAPSRILRITPDGKPSVIAGPGAAGNAANVRLTQAQGIVVMDDGSMVVADYVEGAIRHIDPKGKMTTLVSGNPSDAPVVEYALANADGIALGPRQELYIVDEQRVLVLEAGELTTFAGGGAENADGGLAANALLAGPSSIAISRDGVAYISERDGNRIRKVLADGTIVTIAGKGTPGFAGDGGSALDAQLNGPRGLVYGPDGSIYFADQGNDRIRRITPDGIILTAIGGGKNPFVSGHLATDITLDKPDGLTIGSDGALYVTTMNDVYKVVSGQADMGAMEYLVPSADGLTLYRFNERGKHLSTIDAMTGVTTLTFGYDAAGLLATLTDKDGLVTTIKREAAGQPSSIVGPYGQVTVIGLYSNGDVATVTDPIARTMQLNWDPTTGLLGEVIDPIAKKTTFAYDPVGRLTDVRDPTDSMDPTGPASHHFDSTVTLDGFVNVSAKTKAGKVTQYYSRNITPEIWERSVRQPDGSSHAWTETPGIDVSVGRDGTRVTSYLVPDVAYGAQSMVPAAITVDLPSGKQLAALPMRWKTFSDQNNPLSLDTWRDEVDVNDRVYETAYSRTANTLTTTSPMGRKSTTTLDILGRPVSTSGPGLPTVSWTYDDDGRVVTVTATADGTTRNEVRGYGTDGWLASRQNSLGEKIAYIWDAVGRADRILRPDGNHTKWMFDTADNVKELTPPGRTAHAFEYDPNTKLLTLSTPPAVAQSSTPLLAGQQSYTYGPDHELTAITRSDGRTIAFAYTEAGRLASQTLASAAVTFGYNASGVLTTVNRSDSVKVEMTHDGPLWTGTSWSGAISGSVKADYDANFWLKSLTVNDASTVSFSYDNDGLLVGATSTAGGMTVSREPNTGMVTGTALGSITTSTAYNGFGEPTSLSGSAAGAVLLSQTLTRDALGRISHVTESALGVPHETGYTYDNLGRLTAATRDGVTTTYSYDLNGNRTSVQIGANTAVAVTFDAQDRILTQGAATFEMTPHGDLLRKADGGGSTELTYDEFGNLLKANVTAGGVTKTIEYVVDGFGRRVARKVNGAFDRAWLYRDSLRPVSEVDSAGTFTHFVYVDTSSGAPDFMIRSGVLFRILKDHLGSIRAVVNAQSGAVVQALEYDAYGVVLNDTNPELQPFGFAGGLYDAQTGLVRFGARDYDASIGRWTNKDPIGFGGGDTNIYAYVGGDPVNRRDPSGLDTYMCIKPLHAFGGEGSKSGPDGWGNPFYHQFVCVRDTNGNTTCGGQDRAGANILRTGGKPSNDTWPTEGHGECQNMDDHVCVDNCMLGRIQNPSRPAYGIGPFGTDCQEWADDALSACQAQCGSYQ